MVEFQDEKRTYSLQAHNMTQLYHQKYRQLSERGISKLLFIELPCAVVNSVHRRGKSHINHSVACYPYPNKFSRCR